MTIERVAGYVVFHCDKCSESLDTEDEDFTEAWQGAKSEGWRSFKNKRGQWEHSCPSCTEEFRQRDR